MAQFQFIIDGDLVEFDRWEDVPELFDHVIKFIPDIILPPHTQEPSCQDWCWRSWWK